MNKDKWERKKPKRAEKGQKRSKHQIADRDKLKTQERESKRTKRGTNRAQHRKTTQVYSHSL